MLCGVKFASFKMITNGENDLRGNKKRCGEATGNGDYIIVARTGSATGQCCIEIKNHFCIAIWQEETELFSRRLHSAFAYYHCLLAFLLLGIDINWHVLLTIAF